MGPFTGEDYFIYQYVNHQGMLQQFNLPRKHFLTLFPIIHGSDKNKYSRQRELFNASKNLQTSSSFLYVNLTKETKKCVDFQQKFLFKTFCTNISIFNSNRHFYSILLTLLESRVLDVELITSFNLSGKKHIFQRF